MTSYEEHGEVLRVEGLTKDFPGVRALDSVSLTFRRGEIHVLVGENGAGKSTLVNVLSGVHPHHSYAGKVFLEGREQRFSSPKDAMAVGIAVIHQEFTLVKEATVGENIFLGRWPNRLGVVSWREIASQASLVLEGLSVDVDPTQKVRTLGIGHQQLVEIAKALSLDSKILILDEPSAALAESETERLFDVLRTLRARGLACIYISHRISEVFKIADRITVLRDGEVVGGGSAQDLSYGKVVSMMVGRELQDLFPPGGKPPGEPVLELRSLSVDHPSISGRQVVRDVSLEVRKGEIVGLAGLVGAGRTELVMSIFGAYPGHRRGRILVGGRPVSIRGPRDAIRCGLSLLTEDRKAHGLVMPMSVTSNLTLAVLRRVSNWGVVLTAPEESLASGLARDLRIKAPALGARVSTLSGGNQQKVVLGRWLATSPKVLILDEPTRGIDVGTKFELYHLVRRLADGGVGVLLVSSDLKEILGMSDRVVVMCDGRVTGVMPRSEATEKAIMTYATGVGSSAAG